MRSISEFVSFCSARNCPTYGLEGSMKHACILFDFNFHLWKQYFKGILIVQKKKKKKKKERKKKKKKNTLETAKISEF